MIHADNRGARMTTAHEVAGEAMKATPPIGVVSLSLAGVSLSDWVLLATLIYTLLQLYFLIRDKWWRKRYRGQERRKRG